MLRCCSPPAPCSNPSVEGGRTVGDCSVRASWFCIKLVDLPRCKLGAHSERAFSLPEAVNSAELYPHFVVRPRRISTRLQRKSPPASTTVPYLSSLSSRLIWAFESFILRKRKGSRRAPVTDATRDWRRAPEPTRCIHAPLRNALGFFADTRTGRAAIQRRCGFAARIREPYCYSRRRPAREPLCR